MPWTLIADDLTGAVDAAVKLDPGPLDETRVMVSPAQSSRIPWPHRAVLSVNTDTRHADESQSRLIIEQVFLEAVQRGRTRLFKKVDSLLRGNVGVEIATTLELHNRHIGSTVAVVAPSFPQMDRIIHHGELFVHGQASGVNLCDLLDASGLATTVLTAPRRAEDLTERILQARDRGYSAVIVDAHDDAELAQVAQASSPLANEVLFVGTAGLAGALNPRHPGRHDPAQTQRLDDVDSWVEASPGHPSSDPVIPSPTLGQMVADQRSPVDAGALIIIGSYSEQARRQSRHLARLGVPTFVITPEQGLAHGSMSSLISDVTGLLKCGRSVILTPPGPDQLNLRRAAEVADSLGSAAAAVMGNAAMVVLTGGETAAAVLTHLEVGYFDVLSEVIPGVVVSRLPGWRQPLITKSGSFGQPDALSRAVAHTRHLNERNHL
jgi:uncharacterized protein YgbK (DUF1537 family)